MNFAVKEKNANTSVINLNLHVPYKWGRRILIFFTSEKIRIGFSRFSGRSCEVIESECLQSSLLSQIMASRFADINSVEQFIEDQKTKIQERGKWQKKPDLD